MTAIRPMLLPSLEADADDHLAAAAELLAARGADSAALLGDRVTILDGLSQGSKPRLILLDICAAAEPANDVATHPPGCNCAVHLAYRKKAARG